ncbi:MAG: hypothetical protein AAF662_05510 [Pseudomonadota bacterium]
MTKTSGNIDLGDSELESVLGPENTEVATAASNDHVEAVRRGDVTLDSGQAMPTTPQEWEALSGKVRRDYLLDAVMELIREEGVEIASHSWEGEGLEISPGSSFWANAMEYKGLYAWFSDVESEGPFVSRDDAIDAMCAHCNATRDECVIE